MAMDLIVNIMLGIIVAATPLVFAAIGELVVEKSGVLNLGVEGMMIVGAVAGFAATIETGSFLAGIVAAMLAGALIAFLFGVLTQTLLANQVATGLALTMFGLGISALIGQSYSGKSAPEFPKLDIPGLTDLPVVGPLIFGQDALVYLSFALVVAVSWFLSKTRTGLIIRAIGENHDAAHAIGYPVVAYRYAALLFGGACAGLGGAYLSIVQTPLMGGEHDRRPRLDRARPRRLRRMAAVARLLRRLPVRRHHHRPASQPGAGSRGRAAASRHAALSCDHRRSRAHLVRQGQGPAQRTGQSRSDIFRFNLTGTVPTIPIDSKSGGLMKS